MFTLEISIRAAWMPWGIGLHARPQIKTLRLRALHCWHRRYPIWFNPCVGPHRNHCPHVMQWTISIFLWVSVDKYCAGKCLKTPHQRLQVSWFSRRPQDFFFAIFTDLLDLLISWIISWFLVVWMLICHDRLSVTANIHQNKENITLKRHFF